MYDLESNVWDNFILGGMYKKSGAHSYPEKMHINYPMELRFSAT